MVQDAVESKKIISSRFVLTLKDVGTCIERASDRLVAQEHTDADKPFLIDSTSAMNHSSLCLILGFASITGDRI